MMEPKGIAGACECAKQKWIPVAERLPEPVVEVLVYTQDHGICVDYHNGDEWGFCSVTHWMPLPEPPK